MISRDSIGQCISLIIIVLNCLLTCLLVWLLDRWNFMFQYWRTCSDEVHLREMSSRGKSIACVNNLTKTFEHDEIVLDDISFTFYENENVCLLGPKYSGKTTLFNCLVGFCNQISGQIAIETQMNSIGICPEFNILFDFYTVNEQIEFYSKVRRHEIGFDILDRTELKPVEHQLCRCLSSDMKRCLSIACAFIGETKTIFLDESSSRFDRLICSLTNDDRHLFRTKTHLNDELFDRILVLANGKLQFDGTQKKFYNEFDFDSKLIVKKDSLVSIDDLFNHFSSITIQTDSSNENYVLYLKSSFKNQFYEIDNSHTIANQCDLLFKADQIYQGLPFYLNQFIGLLNKYLLVHYRSYLFLFSFFFLPILFNLPINLEENFIYKNQPFSHL